MSPHLHVLLQLLLCDMFHLQQIKWFFLIELGFKVASEKPKEFTDGTVRYGNVAFSSEPLNLHEALTVPHWKMAMNDEHSALMRNKTWHLVPAQPSRNVIDCK
jgi:hypothetical protein